MRIDTPLRLSILGIVLVLVFGVLAYGGYQFLLLRSAHLELVAHTEELAKNLTRTEDENTRLAEALATEEKKNGSFESQIENIAGTVGTLQKLAETDPELLAKYSKIYFLNENYTPVSLATIDAAYVYNPDRTLEIHAQVQDSLERMMDDAAEDGITLKIVSAYRSFGEQGTLKNAYTVSYGAGANRFSADQGYSEHQLGTTVDFTTPGLSGALTGFDTTEAYAWLEKRAYRYGFILSYPKNNAYYIYEPWHWRFVGTELARYLHTHDETFYGLDQRQIDTYLISLFD